MIPLAIQVRHGMNIVGYGIGIDDLKGLIGLETDDVRMKPAAALIDHDRCLRHGKVLAFESLFYVDECIRESVPVADEKGFFEYALAVISFNACRVFAHIDSFRGWLRSGVMNRSLDRRSGRWIYFEDRCGRLGRNGLRSTLSRFLRTSCDEEEISDRAVKEKARNFHCELCLSFLGRTNIGRDFARK